MSGVNGFFVSNTPPGHNVSSLQTLGRPCPDSRTNTWKLLALPRKAMPVGIFRPEANTDALNPGGRLMDGGRVGSKNAVLSMHCGSGVGFATVAAHEKVGNANNGASASAPVRRYEVVVFMFRCPPLYLFLCVNQMHCFFDFLE